MEHVKDTSQRAAEAMSQGSVPCTSAEAMLPLTSQNFAEAGASALRHSGAQSSVMLSAMLGVFILAAAAAFFLYRKLEKQEVARHAGAGMLRFASPHTWLSMAHACERASCYGMIPSFKFPGSRSVCPTPSSVVMRHSH